MSIVRVALDLPLSRLFDYSLNAGMHAVVGQRLLVPFGRKQVVGVVMELVETSDLADERIKPVSRILDDVAPLPEEMLRLLRFCSDYYHYPLGATVLSALPARLRSDEPVALKTAPNYALTAAGQMLEPSSLSKRQKVQLRLLDELRQGVRSLAQLRTLSASAPAALQALIDAGWVEQVADVPADHRFASHHSLTDEQQAAVDAVTATQGYGCFLLHGITGSGKTEVYVHLMHYALAQGRQVLLLVPEINLTPQLESYFRSRFPDAALVSLHSGLGDGERTQNWLRAQNGQARIVLGTRLSVFTPLPELGLILVDEEHDSSYKQQDGLRYSARDVAIFRAHQRAIPIVLGSATPALESWHNAQNGRYRLLRLTQRAVAQATLPSLRLIHTQQVLMQEGLSPQLVTALEARLQRGEQSLLFINRRGYAPVLMCTACGWLSACPHCAGKLVLHLPERRLRCHHCGLQQRVPHACPSCGNPDLQPVGIGTQRVEAVLAERFPQARILRVDRDSTRNKGSWSAMRQQIADDRIDILIGTQMLAKGHDFPKLTLVGVLNPDDALYSSDFRASERLFAQLAQVAGRAGRADKPGEVIIQTAFPDHPLFQALREYDYVNWAGTLLGERQQAAFPPYCFQAMLRAEGLQADSVFGFLHLARKLGGELAHPVELYGVVPAALPRRANHTRAQLLVQADTRATLQAFLRAWLPLLETLPAAKLRWSLDVDPLEF
jgi:primosomal protein N' (replication factor Y)